MAAPPQSGVEGMRGRQAAPSLGLSRAQQQGQSIRGRRARRVRTRAGLAAKDAQFSGASNEPGFRPIGARGAELRVLQCALGDSARISGTGRTRIRAQLREYRQP